MGAPLDPDNGCPFLVLGPYLQTTFAVCVRNYSRLLSKSRTSNTGPREQFDSILSRTLRGPLSDVPPNIAHFSERMNPGPRDNGNA